MEIGKRLQEERIAQGKSLEEIKNVTKIQTRHLKAIEENDWPKMPGNFYVRAFIREYAEALGMDPAMLLEEHKDELPQLEEANYEYATPSRSSRSSRRSNSAVFSFFPKLLVFILVIGLIFGIWYAYVNYIHPAITEDEDEAPIEEQEIIAPDPEDDEEESEEDQDENGEDNEEETTDEEAENEAGPNIEVVSVDTDAGTPITTVQVTGTDTLELRFETNEETYLWVRGVEGGSVQESYFEQMFYANQSPLEIDASDSNEIDLNIGNTPALTFYINDVEFEYEDSSVHQKVLILFEGEE